MLGINEPDLFALGTGIRKICYDIASAGGNSLFPGKYILSVKLRVHFTPGRGRLQRLLKALCTVYGHTTKQVSYPIIFPFTSLSLCFLPGFKMRFKEVTRISNMAFCNRTGQFECIPKHAKTLKLIILTFIESILVPAGRA